MPKLKQPKVHYEPGGDVLSWEINSRAIDHAKEIGNMIVHFSKDNTPVAVEILEASKFVSQTSRLINRPKATITESALHKAM